MVSTAPIPSCCLQRLRKHRRRRRGDGLHGLLGRPQAPLLRGHHGHGLGIRGTLLPREDLLPVLGWAALFWGWVDGLGWVGMGWDGWIPKNWDVVGWPAWAWFHWLFCWGSEVGASHIWRKTGVQRLGQLDLGWWKNHQKWRLGYWLGTKKTLRMPNKGLEASVSWGPSIFVHWPWVLIHVCFRWTELATNLPVMRGYRAPTDDPVIINS